VLQVNGCVDWMFGWDATCDAMARGILGCKRKGGSESNGRKWFGEWQSGRVAEGREKGYKRAKDLADRK
jgi:hypothetical protein